MAYRIKGNVNSIEKYNEAFSESTKAIQIDPNYSFAYNNRGFSLHAI
jgi:hypothetical protein